MITTNIETPPKQTHEDVFVFPVSFAQKRLWFLQQLQPENSAYNESGVFHCRGKLNTIALEQSLNEIIRRHEVLRTYFVIEKGEPVQVILPSLILKLPVIDLRSISENEREVQVKQLIKKETEQPFDLTQAPLIRFSLLQLTENEYILISVIHHIVNDGWSSGVFFKEIEALYEAFNNNQPSPLPELSIQYADFTIHQNNYLQGEELEKLLNYWQQQLKNLSVLELPTDRMRPTTETYKGATKTLLLPKELCNAIKTLGQQQGVTLFMTLLAAFKTLLYRYTQQQDIAVGTPIAGRNLAQTETLIGFFVNNLVLRTNLEGNPSFLEFLSQVRQVALGAYAHQDMPFEKLVDILKPERDLGRSPLFQVMFVLQNTPLSKIKFSGVKLETIPIEKNISKYDLTLAMEEISAEESSTLDLERNTGLLDRNKWGMIAAFEYNTDLFEVETIERMAEHFQTLLSCIVANPECPISELPLLTEAERNQLLVEWNDTAIEYPKDKCIHQLFEEQVEKTPDAIAVVFEQEQLTYQQLNAKANQLAHYLQSLGVKPETLVGICIERSVEMVIGLLGILKAGGAYLPLDPSYPAERLSYMFKDASVSVLLTKKSLVVSLPEHQAQVFCLDRDWEIIDSLSQQNLDSGVKAENFAYVMYTSGSTGQPKGVSIIHQGVVRLVKQTNYVELTSSQVFLQLAPFSFDASTFETWGCLLNGSRLVVMSPGTPSLETIGKIIEKNQVTTLWLTAALFQLMVDEQQERLKSVTQLLAGGDVLPLSHVEKVMAYLPDCQLINGYGPTENTTFTCCYQVQQKSEQQISVPIGRPISNTQVYILDANLQPVPIGIPGELHIGGDGLARDYLNRPELTKEKFIPNPFDNNSKLYKTGDLARYLPDGNIEFIGRIDNQVKLRGFRIELGEIESALSTHPQVRQTVVICREDIPGNKQLVAYLLTSEPELNSTELRPYLQSKLPEYMVPSAFVLLDNLPLTPNGKIDRKALPAPDINLTRSHEYVPPQTETEKHIATVLQEVLQLEKVSIYDNFFELGANSLMLVKIHSNLQEILSIELPLVDMFTYPNIKALSQHLSKKIETPEFSPEVPQLERKQVKDSLRKRRKLRQKH